MTFVRNKKYQKIGLVRKCEYTRDNLPELRAFCGDYLIEHEDGKLELSTLEGFHEVTVGEIVVVGEHHDYYTNSKEYFTENYIDLDSGYYEKKKPTYVDAIKYTGNNRRQLQKFVGDDLIIKESQLYIRHEKGPMPLDIGDYAVINASRHCYRVKEDVFNDDYEKVFNKPLRLFSKFVQKKCNEIGFTIRKRKPNDRHQSR